MIAPFFFSEFRQRTVGAAPVRDFREKTVVFCRESPTIHPLGSADKPSGLPAVHRGFLTRAAKPKVRKSLTPQIPLLLQRSSSFYFRLRPCNSLAELPQPATR